MSKQFICTAPKECRPFGDRLPPNGSQLLPDFPLSYQGDCEEYERYIASLPRYQIISSNNYEVGETFEGEIILKIEPFMKPEYVVHPVHQEKEDVLDKSRQTLESFLEMSDEEILNKIKEIKDRLSIRAT